MTLAARNGGIQVRQTEKQTRLTIGANYSVINFCFVVISGQKGKVHSCQHVNYVNRFLDSTDVYTLYMVLLTN